MTRRKIIAAIAVCIVALLALLITGVVKKQRQAAYARRFQGAWEGTMSSGAGRVQHRWRFVFKISELNGVQHIAVDEIDFGLKNVLPSTLAMGKLAIDFNSDSFSYHGVLHNGGNDIRGIWRWGQSQFLLTLEKTNAPDTVPEPLAPEDYAPRQGSDLQGIWKGTVTNKSSTMRLYLKIAEPANGNFHVELDSIDHPPLVHLPVTLTNYTRPHLRFTVEGNGGLFLGNLNESGLVITGRWKQASFVPLTLVHADTNDEEQALDAGGNYNHTRDTELQGHWSGTLPEMDGLQLRIAVHIAQMPDGSFSAEMDSPDQLLFRIPLGQVQFSPPNVRFKSKGGKDVFVGNLLDGKLSGAWTYGSASRTVTLEREQP